MKVYKLGFFWSILIYLITPPLICIFIWLLFRPLTDKTITDYITYYLFITPISLGLSFYGFIAILDVKKNRVILYNDRIEYKSTLKNRTLYFTEIKGFKHDEKYIHIEPKETAKKRISISSYFGELSDLEIQLGNKIQDLDLLDLIETNVEINKNEDFGKTEDERKIKLEKAKKIAKFTNWLIGIISLWLVLFPKPYIYALLFSVLSLPFVLIIYKFYNGLIRINEFKSSAYPNIFLGFMLASLIIFLRSLLDFNFLNYQNLWIPSISISLFLFSVLLIGKSEFKAQRKNNIINIIVIFFILFAYSTGLIKTLNCIFDTSRPIFHKTVIIEKRIEDGKTTVYYFGVKPWGKNKYSVDISVSKSEFENFNTNDTLIIATKKGKLDIPWFFISY